MNSSIKPENSTWIGFVAFLLVGIGVLSHRTSAEIQTAGKIRSAAGMVLLHLNAIDSCLSQEELSQRFFHTSGQPGHLKGLKECEARFENSIEKLGTSLVASGDQNFDISELKKLGQTKLVLLRKISGIGPETQDDQLRLEQINQQLDQLLSSHQGKTRTLLDQKIAYMDQQLSGMSIKILVASVVALMLVLFAVARMLRELEVRKKAEQALQSERERLNAIIETQYAIATAGLNLEAVMKRIVEGTESLTKAEGVSVELLQGDKLYVRTSIGLVESCQGLELPVHGSLSGSAVLANKKMYLPDALTEDLATKSLIQRLGVRAVLVMPITFEQQIEGVLKIVSREVNAFNEHDHETLQILAGLLGSSLAYARQFEAKQKAESLALDASRLKSEFLATVSHEIRTPINGIIGMSALLEDTSLTDEQQDHLQNIQVSADSLLGIVNDILDFSKVEAGKLDLENLEFELDHVVSDLGKMISISARQKGLSFVVKQNGSWARPFRGDQGRLRQVLLNLLSNATKFTSKGGVELRISILDEDTHSAQIQFEVADTGIGISDEAKGRMFQAFSQVDASTTRRFGGTGLGLSITKKLVELMGGQISFTSILGKGSTFSFQLRFAKAEARSTGHESEHQGSVIHTPSPKRILVAEDNPINQLVILGYLKKIGHRAMAVASGKEALEVLDKMPFDLILMDCQMPELDGYEATKAIRLHLNPLIASLPIVAMTANAIKGDRERCLEVGMNDYLSKPLKAKELHITLEHWFNQTSSRSASEDVVEKREDFPVLDEETFDLLRSMPSRSGESLLDQLLDLYYESTPRALGRMRDAYALDDFKALKFESHSLKSASAALGLKQIEWLCLQIEIAEDNVSKARFLAWLDELDVAYTQALSRLSLIDTHAA